MNLSLVAWLATTIGTALVLRWDFLGSLLNGYDSEYSRYEYIDENANLSLNYLVPKLTRQKNLPHWSSRS